MSPVYRSLLPTTASTREKIQKVHILESENAETKRLHEDEARTANWKRWGPYLSERQWATVREDYSDDGNCWEYFPHDHARSRAYRWGEDGILGISDRQCRLCFSLGLWNEKDAILKERLFGLTGSQGNHGEDVKELYYYLDSTPTHSYMKGLYKYPQSEYPYAELERVNRESSIMEPEYELEDTKVFDDSAYWDVFAEYAKASPNDILIRITVANRAKKANRIHLLPTLWYRNTWIWGCKHEGCSAKPKIKKMGSNHVTCKHESLEDFIFTADESSNGCSPTMLFTENETNTRRLYNVDNYTPYTKDAFHRYIINNDKDAVSPKERGTKIAAYYVLDVAAESEVTVYCRLHSQKESPAKPFGPEFEKIFTQRILEADRFYNAIQLNLNYENKLISRQAFAGLLWSKQFYHIVIDDWLHGDTANPPPPASRLQGRNNSWKHLFNRDVISMPDKWEYPWYASWDLAFHMVPLARIDPCFAKDQLLLFLREWYMAPNGQIPAYEFAFDDVNPPVHAWAVWRVFKLASSRSNRDHHFLARCFQKLVINFTWWVNRKDPNGQNIFSGGFLGLDNIGIFDRSKPLPTGGYLEQADGTAWMAFYAVCMLDIALELAQTDIAYEDMASKFFEHFVAIVDAINTMGGSGLWDETDGFYYDRIRCENGQSVPLKIRSMVGLVPLFSCLILNSEMLNKLPGFSKRLDWFLKYRQDLASQIAYMNSDSHEVYRLLAIPSENKLRRVLRYVFDENEFLSPYGIRSLSKIHEKHPFVFNYYGNSNCVRYVPGESNTYLFGGNSNWRGPIWLNMNFLIMETLERYDHYYGDSFTIEFPTNSGNKMTLRDASFQIAKRLCKLFITDEFAKRPCHGDSSLYQHDPNFRDLVLFYEYFHGDTGRGCGASHQTGWTGVIATCILKYCQERSG
ncbi:Uncharacterized protein TrispH2_002019 [Trichoplax sp. H2]|nr:Uncharacterized protein TrispH2_002019 [Trichoplax sp. H2]|eukprot:RDD46434.1 Uncharacterized protein TrispH2_002019 [Trichoplax sp. H2]